MFAHALRTIVLTACCLGLVELRPASAAGTSPAGKSSGVAVPASAFQVTPAEPRLSGNFSQVQLVVTATGPGGKSDERSADLTAAAKYVSSDPKIVKALPGGRLLAQANGRATLTISVGGLSRTVPVEVSGIVAAPVVSFTEQVVPILSKAGCNAAACHASQHGKGGFKLSVFGYAPDEDYAAIVRDRQGRRVNQLDPEQSLILLKPTLTIPHGGNRRIAYGSVDYDILRNWLASGAQPPKKDDPLVTAVSVFPAKRLGKIGLTQQLRVEATYSNGTKRDVTPWAKFDSMDDSIVTVSQSGMFKAIGDGQTAVMVRFEGQAEIAMLVVPYSDRVNLTGWRDNNFIDRLAAAKFRELGISPSLLCDDATFLRRAYFDAIGTLPTIEESLAFFDSKDPQKRSKLVDRLLGLTGDPALDVHNNEYAAYWSVKWSDLIRSSSGTLGEQGMWAMHNWIKESLRQNKPFDQFVRELVTAKGSIYRNGPANYYRVATNPLDLAETTAQLFLGVRLTCAKCHHHPFEKYSQADYYSFAAFFSRVGSKASRDFGLFGREQVVMVRSAGDVRHPRSGQIMKPTPLEGESIDDPLDRRIPLAAWLTSRENRFFARNIVNRYMAYLLGRGLVEPVDDLRATNPASNPPLMEALADDFAASGFNVKHLIRTIMTSRLYQLDSQPTKDNASDSRFFSHYRVKRIAAEPLLDAIDYATNVQTKFKDMPLGTRAIELPDADYPDYFLTTFGKPRRASVCECERVADENLSQALHTLNGDILAAKIANAKGRVSNLLAAKKTHEQIVAELYLATLSRRPNKQEQAACARLLKSSPSPRVFYEDLLWSLINSKQFLFVR
ncbi:MAG TPA: DUF1549 and DUF1553 domain-containing protein [Pirellulales bacterium]|jgi:hypothetical protein|nr:DUF1549 and DUF1553 domain-containing protein [Pirellulales bacterium]